MGKPEFRKGMEVEVCSDDQGLRGAWFIATILRSVPRKRQVLVQYHTLMAEEESTKPLKESVDIVNIRPIAPREIDRSFDVSDEVDAVHNDGWWEGIVIKVLEDFRYLVYFRTGKEEHVFERSELRIHREWVHGDWVPPMVMEEIRVEEEKVADQLQKTGKQDTNAVHNQIVARSGLFMHHLNPDQQQCRRSGKNWHCLLMAPSGKVYCEMHQVEQDNHNERRRKNYATKQSRFTMDPPLPSLKHQHRRSGKVKWHCYKMASLGKLSHEKHQLEQDTHNVKKRKGKIEPRGCDQIKSLNGYRLTGLKRTRREVGKNVSSLSSTMEDHQPFPLNGGLKNEAADNDQAIVQIGCRQTLSPTSHDQQAWSLWNGRSDHSFADDTNGNQQSFRNALPFRSTLDYKLKTAEREFSDEKYKFDEIKASIDRSSTRLQALLTDIKLKAEKVVEL